MVLSQQHDDTTSNISPPSNNNNANNNNGGGDVENPVETLFNLGLQEYSQRNFQKAVEYYLKADQLEPNNASILFHLSSTLELMGKFEEGFNEYNRFIEIYESLLNDEHREHYKDGIVKAWLGAGNCIKSMNRFDEAAQYYTKVLDFKDFPIHSLGYYNRASCYFHSGKFREAIDDFSEMIKVLSGSSGDFSNQNLKMVASVISNLDVSVCYFFKAQSHTNLGEYEQAIKDLTLIINDYEQTELVPAIKNNALLSGNDIKFNTYYTRAECYLRSGEFEKCLGDTTKVIEIVQTIDPSNAELLSNLYLTKADLLLEMKKLEESLSDCVKSMELNPRNSRSLFTASIIYKFNKENEKALNLLKKVIELEPENTHALEILKEWEK